VAGSCAARSGRGRETSKYFKTNFSIFSWNINNPVVTSYT
jgi:hypothetical protein